MKLGGVVMRFGLCWILLVVLAVGGCQTTSEKAGKKAVTPSTAAASAIEDYLKTSGARAFAISESGSYWYWNSCPASRCLWEYGDAETTALKNCEKRSPKCWLFAVYHDVVWRGPIDFASTAATEGYEFSVKHMESARSTATMTGYANDVPERNVIELTIRLDRQPCTGEARHDDGTWSLDCGGGKTYAGRFEKSSDSLYWGHADNAPMEFSIRNRTWPTLRAKLAERPAS